MFERIRELVSKLSLVEVRWIQILSSDIGNVPKIIIGKVSLSVAGTLRNCTTFLYLFSEYSRYVGSIEPVHSQNRRCRSMRCAASRPSLDHLAPVFAPVVCRCVISFPVGLIILTPLRAGTQWDIAAGGESIFTHPEIDRPRNESLHREGESGLQCRRDAHPHSQWNFLTLLTYLQRFANIITSSAYVG